MKYRSPNIKQGPTHTGRKLKQKVKADFQCLGSTNTYAQLFSLLLKYCFSIVSFPSLFQAEWPGLWPSGGPLRSLRSGILAVQRAPQACGGHEDAPHGFPCGSSADQGPGCCLGTEAAPPKGRSPSGIERKLGRDIGQTLS